MAECLVGLCHLVRVFTLLHRPATAFCGVHELTGQAQIHRFLTTLLGGFTQPTHGKGQATHRAHFNRHLIVRTTYTAALNFDQGLDVVDRGVEHLDRLFASFSLDLVQSTVHDALCNGLLARQHNNVHEFGQLYAAKLGVGENLTLGNFATTRHFLLPCDCSVEPLCGHGILLRSATYMRRATPNAALNRPKWPMNRLGFLGTLSTVLGTGLFAILNALKVEGTANDVVTHTGQVLYTTAAHENDRVFLQVVAFTTDVGNHFVAVGKTHFGDFTQSGVRLLGGSGVHASADTTTLRAVFKSRALAAFACDFARLARELTNGWHDLYASCCLRYSSDMTRR